MQHPIDNNFKNCLIANLIKKEYPLMNLISRFTFNARTHSNRLKRRIHAPPARLTEFPQTIRKSAALLGYRMSRRGPERRKSRLGLLTGCAHRRTRLGPAGRSGNARTHALSAIANGPAVSSRVLPRLRHVRLDRL